MTLSIFLRRSETGEYLALDLGGTNFRVLLVTLKDGRMVKEVFREAPFNLSPPPCGHCPFGGGVLTLARMVWGTFLEKNFPSSNGHLLDFGGV